MLVFGCPCWWALCRCATGCRGFRSHRCIATVWSQPETFILDFPSENPGRQCSHSVYSVTSSCDFFFFFRISIPNFTRKQTYSTELRVKSSLILRFIYHIYMYVCTHVPMSLDPPLLCDACGSQRTSVPCNWSYRQL